MPLFGSTLAYLDHPGSALKLDDLRQIEAAREKYSDFDAVNFEGVDVSQTFTDFLSVSARPCDLFYCLAKDRARAAALFKLPPDDQLRELAAIEEQFQETGARPC